MSRNYATIGKFGDCLLVNTNYGYDVCMFDALVSHAYNTGGSSTLFYYINTGIQDYQSWWLNKYITIGGGKEVLKGLVKRRGEELEMFLS